MTFDEAMKQVDAGRKVRKAGWPATGYLVKGPKGGLVNDAGKPYEPTSVDRAMTDWGISEVPDTHLATQGEGMGQAVTSEDPINQDETTHKRKKSA
jgi:hypothetical protein